MTKIRRSSTSSVQTAAKSVVGLKARLCFFYIQREPRVQQERINPTAYVKDDGNLVIIASKGGAPTNPDWYYNILTNPLVTVEVGKEKFQARAAVTEEPERSHLYEKMVEMMPGFDEYRKKTTRKIPVITLTPVK